MSKRIMYIEVEGAHFFTDRVDLAYRSVYNFYKSEYDYTQTMRKHIEGLYKRGLAVEKELFDPRSSLNRIKHVTIIRYPHVLSHFSDLNCASWHAAEFKSNRRKEPVLVSTVGFVQSMRMSMPPGFRWYKFAFADKGKCISEWVCDPIRPYSLAYRRFAPENCATIPETHGHLFATDPTAIVHKGSVLPADYIANLERELGIFLGSTPLEDFLATCTKVKETEYATVYKSDRLA